MFVFSLNKLWEDCSTCPGLDTTTIIFQIHFFRQPWYAVPYSNMCVPCETKPKHVDTERKRSRERQREMGKRRRVKRAITERIPRGVELLINLACAQPHNKVCGCLRRRRLQCTCSHMCAICSDATWKCIYMCIYINLWFSAAARPCSFWFCASVWVRVREWVCVYMFCMCACVCMSARPRTRFAATAL